MMRARHVLSTPTLHDRMPRNEERAVGVPLMGQRGRPPTPACRRRDPRREAPHQTRGHGRIGLVERGDAVVLLGAPQLGQLGGGEAARLWPGRADAREIRMVRGSRRRGRRCGRGGRRMGGRPRRVRRRALLRHQQQEQKPGTHRAPHRTPLLLAPPDLCRDGTDYQSTSTCLRIHISIATLTGYHKGSSGRYVMTKRTNLDTARTSSASIGYFSYSPLTPWFR